MNIGSSLTSSSQPSNSNLLSYPVNPYYSNTNPNQQDSAGFKRKIGINNMNQNDLGNQKFPRIDNQNPTPGVSVSSNYGYGYDYNYAASNFYGNNADLKNPFKPDMGTTYPNNQY